MLAVTGCGTASARVSIISRHCSQTSKKAPVEICVDKPSVISFCFSFVHQDKLFPQAIDYLQRAFSVRHRVGPVLLSRYRACHIVNLH